MSAEQVDKKIMHTENMEQVSSQTHSWLCGTLRVKHYTLLVGDTQPKLRAARIGICVVEWE